MFEKYTEKARRVIFFARYEASQFGALAIEPEHVLLGVIREDQGLVNRHFGERDRVMEPIRKEIEARSPIREKVSVSVDLPLSQSARRVLGYAADEASRLRHHYIGTHHLLLGLLREENTVAFDVLSRHGLRFETVREKIEGAARGDYDEPNLTAVDRVTLAPAARGSAEDTIGADAGHISGLVGDYTDKAALVFPNSWGWATRFDSPDVKPEHLLLSLLEVDRWLVQYFLTGDSRTYFALADDLLRGTDPLLTPAAARPLAAATLRVLDRADAEAKRSAPDHSPVRTRVDTEHLLLGILDEEDSDASRALRRYGMDPARVRREIVHTRDDEN